MSKDKKKTLSIEETAKLFGAEPPIDLGEIQLSPIGMTALASRIAGRMASKRGRPTDKSWDVVRKIKMSHDTWDSLGELAGKLGRDGLRVAQGQVGAIALEVGLKRLRDENSQTAQEIAEKARNVIQVRFREEIEKEAEALCSVASNEGLW